MSRDLRQPLLDSILSGVDVLPDEVAAFLRERADMGDRDVADAFFGTALPSLCAHLPDLAAELTERFLCYQPQEDDIYGAGPLHLPGLHSFPRCFRAPWPYAGPFFPLLRVKPDAGIDLVVRVTNHATRMWQRRERSHLPPGPRTPLPVMVSVGGLERELWGDERVYGWFRCNSVAPTPVCCGLMALEQWLLEQAEEGTDVSPYLTRILSQAESAALAGVTLSLWLAHPEMCTAAAYPVLRCPAFWKMDWERCMRDQSAEAEAIVSMQALMQPAVAQTLRQIVHQPHRQARIETALLPLLAGEHPVAVRLLSDVQTFPDSPQFVFAEEDTPEARADWHETLRAACMRLDLANYTVEETDAPGQMAVRYVPPPEHRAIMEAANRGLAGLTVVGLAVWAEAYAVDGARPDFMTLEEAAGRAEHLLNEETDPALENAAYIDRQRIEACIMVAAGLLAEDWKWAEEHDKLAWCRELLLSALGGIESAATTAARSTLGPSPALEAAARAVPPLVATEPDNEQLRAVLASLLAWPDNEVSLRAFRASRCLWDAKPKLARNVVAFGASLGSVKRFDFNGPLLPEFVRHANRIVKQFAKARPIRMPTLAGLQPWGVNYDGVQGAVEALPIPPQWDEALRAFVLDVADLSVKTHEWVSGDRCFWDVRSFSDFRSVVYGPIAHALLTAADRPTCTRLRDSVMDHWERIPCLLDALLRGLMLVVEQDPSLEDRFVSLWRDLVGQALASAVWDDWHVPYRVRSQLEDLAHTLICTPRFTVSPAEEWPILGQLTDIISRWVARLGHGRDHFAALPRLLGRRGFLLLATHGVGWLHECLSTAPSPAELCNTFGAFPDDIVDLLRRGWEEQRGDLRQSPETWRQLTHLVDLFVVLGNRAAVRLQEEISRTP